MKKLSLAIIALSLSAIPAFAQKSHGNKGGAMRGDERATQVQTASKKKDKDRDRSRDNDKHGKHKGENQGKHKARGHSH